MVFWCVIITIPVVIFITCRCHPTLWPRTKHFLEVHHGFGDLRAMWGIVLDDIGLAKLADRLMDTWMKNPTLNANAKVSSWTESGQRQGFLGSDPIGHQGASTEEVLVIMPMRQTATGVDYPPSFQARSLFRIDVGRGYSSSAGDDIVLPVSLSGPDSEPKVSNGWFSCGGR